MNNAALIDFALPVILALVASLPGLLAIVHQQRKSKADAAEIITGAASKAVEIVSTQLTQLQTEYEELHADMVRIRRDHETLKADHIALRSQHDMLKIEFDRVLTGAHMLHNQVVGLNGVPVYQPPERRT